jgi:hypothetical protein
MTSSKAFLSPSALSLCLVQNCSIRADCSMNSQSLVKCSCSSTSVNPRIATSVVEHSSRAVLRSSSWPGMLAFGAAGCEMPPDAAASSSFIRDTRPLAAASFGRRAARSSMCTEGKTSFFCLLAGRISSRSTGTPKDTRNKRRMRERIQSGGCSGGGATSCAQSDWERSVRKEGFMSDVSIGGASSALWNLGKMVEM